MVQKTVAEKEAGATMAKAACSQVVSIWSLFV
jgi:hypothetical protein